MEELKPELECRFVSSLEKIFCKAELDAPELKGVSGLRGETISFQIAYMSDPLRIFLHECEVTAPEGVGTEVFNVALVPCEYPAIYEDPYILTSDPGMFPDPLLKFEGPYPAVRGKWNALWISVTPGAEARPGKYELKIRIAYRPYVPSRPGLVAPEYEKILTLPLTIHPAELAPQKLIFTQWFYADCLASVYHVETWSERHWELMENYFRDMTSHGVNMLYTPLWTVPLDTAIGCERPTAQLLKIRRTADGKYEFDFSRLVRYFELGRKCGFKYFEFSHAFTQWGAGFTPKIVAEVDGREQRIFGWDVTADDPEYERFLSALMPQLTELIRSLGLEKSCRFHVSDEPQPEHFDAYMKAAKLMERLTPGFVKMDALSNVDFYRSGATGCPVPATTFLEDFMKEDIPERWVYYCGNWRDGVPNRQFGMPSYRNRVLGVLLYARGIDGFLHWGYNFYYYQLSRRTDLDPWHTTDAGRAFIGGDNYLVYPGADGHPVTSLHYAVLYEAMQDLRLLQTLEKKIGRDAVLKLIHEGLDYQLTMTDYPKSAEWLLDLHERVLAAL